MLGAGIARAIHQFYSDYSRLPLMTDFVIGEDQDTDTSAAAGLILVLSGREPPGTARQNTRNINYLESMPAASRSAPGHWTGGVVVEGGDVSLVDSWGHAFRVRLDANYNGEIDNPCPEEVRNNGPFLYGRCLVWSAGKDGWEWTWRNNTKSWP
ncbi:MAG: hypothetical protein JWM59_3506 [Verrucomicrobiales bacterium]|nr:hypothetical protein [Verrucomicrobiales bacterium]